MKARKDWSQILTKVFIASVIFSCFGILAQVKFGANPGPIAPVMSALIMLSGAGATALSLRHPAAVVSVLVLGAVAEIIGLFTGFPFGSYEYTDRWVPTVPLGTGHRFPLLLPFAWLLMVGESFLFVRRFWSGWKLALGTGLLAAAIDVPMERAMTDVLGYWRWSAPGPLYGAPHLNFVGWFVVSSLAALVLQRAPSAALELRLILPAFCAFVAWNGILTGRNTVWPLLMLCAVVGAVPAILFQRAYGIPADKRLVALVPCILVAWNGPLFGFDPAWPTLVGFAIWLALPISANKVQEAA